MPGNLLTVASLPTPVEADVVRARLDAEGIRSFLADEMLVGMDWMLGNAVGGVKVRVAEPDYARAVEILSAKHADWICSHCGEAIDGEFDVCWKCGTARDGEADAFDDVRTAPTPPPDEAMTAAEREASEEDLQNPYRSPRAPQGPVERVTAEPTEPRDTSDGDAVAVRAFRASVLGLVFCPFVLQAYSVFLLLWILFGEVPLGPAGARRYYAAWIFNVAFTAVVATVFYFA